MANILYLVHRMPYPPDKGDKVRSYHVLRHLAARHRAFVGTFVDDPADAAHLPALEALCAGVHAVPLSTKLARIASLRGLLTGSALTMGYYADRGLMRWVRQTAERESIDAVVVFSSSMVPYAEALAPGVPVLVDLVDVDSAKWSGYADNHRWPLSWLYRREASTLLAVERRAVLGARASFLATAREVDLLLSLAPECAGRVHALGNGVDADTFAPDPARATPFAPGERPVVFTGAMDYWPNVDAVCRFAAEVLPALRQRHPTLRFHVVGRSPAPAVRALQGEAVNVTGTVPDVRPYLQHAAVVVAPLRLARGIQNKLLEAMAMARPVVAAESCVAATSARPGQDLLAVPDDDAAGYASAVLNLLADPERAAAMGQAGRDRVLADYAWPAQLALLDRHLDAVLGQRTGATRAAGAASADIQPLPGVALGGGAR
jgi:sugar transferase (PEP-CTERM/EpsH1 system associated)